MDRRGLLIFDLDGTLFRTETVTIPAVGETFRDHGLPLPADEEIRSFFGKPTKEFYSWIESISPRESASELAAAVSRREIEKIAESGELYTGIPSVLGSLRMRVARMGICSNGVEEYVPRVVKEHGLERYFDFVTFRGESDTDKPMLVRRILDRFEERPAVVIGDRQDDIDAARRNGIYAIAAAYGYGAEEELELADEIAETPSELPRIISLLLEESHT